MIITTVTVPTPSNELFVSIKKQISSDKREDQKFTNNVIALHLYRGLYEMLLPISILNMYVIVCTVTYVCN